MEEHNMCSLSVCHVFISNVDAVYLMCFALKPRHEDEIHIWCLMYWRPNVTHETVFDKFVLMFDSMLL